MEFRGSGGSRWRALERLSLVLLVVVLLLAAAVVAPVAWAGIERYFGGGVTVETPVVERIEPPVPTEPVSIEDKWTKGSPDARVVLIYFGDFECLPCRRFVTAELPALRRQYVDTDRVRLVYWHRPLPSHRRALPAAVAAECAGRAGLFWAMHDRLYASEALDDAGLRRLASAVGLGLSEFDQCFARSDLSLLVDKVRQETSTATLLEVLGTPSVFVGRVVADGSVSVTARWSIRGLSGAWVSEQLDRLLTPGDLGGAKTGELK